MNEGIRYTRTRRRRWKENARFVRLSNPKTIGARIAVYNALANSSETDARGPRIHP